jgi:hypothetical protein
MNHYTLVSMSAKVNLKQPDSAAHDRVEGMDQLEEKLKRRETYDEALGHLREAERLLGSEEQPLRPVHHSSRGRWESQSTSGVQRPRYKR